MNRFVCLVAAAFAVCPFVSSAENWTDETTGIIWRYYNYGDGVSVDSAMKCREHVYYRPSGPLVIPDTLGGRPVIMLGTFAFSEGSTMHYGNTGITSVTFPASIIYSLSDAFGECEDLKAVYISDLSAWCNVIFQEETSNPCYYAHKRFMRIGFQSRISFRLTETEARGYAAPDIHI